MRGARNHLRWWHCVACGGFGLPCCAGDQCGFGTICGQCHVLSALGGGRFLDIYRGSSGYANGRVMTVASGTFALDLGSPYVLNSDGPYSWGRSFPLDSSNFFHIFSFGYSEPFTGGAMIVNVSSSNVVTAPAKLSSMPGSSSHDDRCRSGGPFGAGKYLDTISASGVGEAFSLQASASPASITAGASAVCPAGGCPLLGAAIDSQHDLGFRTGTDGRLAASVVDLLCP